MVCGESRSVGQAIVQGAARGLPHANDVRVVLRTRAVFYSSVMASTALARPSTSRLAAMAALASTAAEAEAVAAAPCRGAVRGQSRR